MFVLGECYKKAERHAEAIDVFTRLYELTLRGHGINSENAVGVARALYDLHDQVGDGKGITLGRTPTVVCLLLR